MKNSPANFGGLLRIATLSAGVAAIGLSSGACKKPGECIINGPEITSSAEALEYCRVATKDAAVTCVDSTNMQNPGVTVYGCSGIAANEAEINHAIQSGKSRCAQGSDLQCNDIKSYYEEEK